MTPELEFTALFPFCGLGAGARGFLDARVHLFGRSARFRSIGGIDIDPLACQDFAALTGSPSLQADIATMTPTDLRRFAGERTPDVVFGSNPCVGFSGLLGNEKSSGPKYQALNQLTVTWFRLVLETWYEDPPGLLLLENVPRITTRGAPLLRQVRKLLGAAGYVFHEQTFDAGELGGLAQHRRRFLLVARHPRSVPPLLYQPPKKRVRACGEVLGELPMPGDPTAGPLHALPRISWLNWVRLALIPAGGDWRDLPGALAAGQKRREAWGRHGVADWEAPTSTVAGAGSNGVQNVADPRVDAETARKLWEQRGIRTEGFTQWFKGKYGVQPWEEPARTVIGGPSNGVGAVADPRIPLSCSPNAHRNKFAIVGWDEPSKTVIGATRPGSGALSVADPRVEAFKGSRGVVPFTEPVGAMTGESYPSNGGNSVADPRAAEWFRTVLRVVPWSEPSGTITGNARPQCGGFSVADPRVRTGFDHAYRVLRFDEPSFTIAGKAHPGCGAYSVADPRLNCRPHAGAYGVLDWREAAKTITGAAAIDNGTFAIADPRLPDAPPLWVIVDPRKPPPFTPVIIAEDGTWHRPLTTLELAALQGLPVLRDGKPLKLAGDSVTEWRRRIGNAVPSPTACAIAEQMLIALSEAAMGSFSLAGSATPVWVREGAAQELRLEAP